MDGRTVMLLFSASLPHFGLYVSTSSPVQVDVRLITHKALSMLVSVSFNFRVYHESILYKVFTSLKKQLTRRLRSLGR